MAERDAEPDPGQGEERDPLLPPDEEAAWEQIVAGYDDEPDTEAPRPTVRSYTVYAAGTAPRDWQAPDEADEEHFVPPEPPPLPETDATTKFGWAGALGGPLLLLAAVLFRFDVTWWLMTLGVGGFVGGCLTLVTRLRPGDEDDYDEPGGGAVV